MDFYIIILISKVANLVFASMLEIPDSVLCALTTLPARFRRGVRGVGGSARGDVGGVGW